MGLLVAYDISSDSRRSKLARLLEDRGTRIQYSVFWISDPAITAADLLHLAHRLIDDSHDRVDVVPLCAACAGRAQSAGAKGMRGSV